MEIDIRGWTDKGMVLLMEYGPKVIMALLIWIIGFWFIRRLTKGFSLVMTKRNYDPGLKHFLVSLVSWALKIMVIIAILGTLGVQTTSFAALIAAAGLAIGLALQGSLSNFAGGILLLLFKPFKVGDWIEAQGVSGSVKKIDIFTTTLNTFGNQLAIIPNGKLSNENIINYHGENTRREDIKVGISYNSNIKKVKQVLLDIAHADDRIIKMPAPEVYVNALEDSSVNLTLRYWATNENFWNVHFYLIEEIKLRFDAEGIEIPYPQLDIHKKD